MSDSKKVLNSCSRTEQRHRSASVLPAHAGMVPGSTVQLSAPSGAPRARGDGPQPPKKPSSPPVCSPRTRGWSRAARHPVPHRVVLPAHAGMVPPINEPPAIADCAPRARGDGPDWVWWGVRRSRCSPRTRGWSPGPGDAGLAGSVLPAHAGMVPEVIGVPRLSRSAPRARGDGPGGENLAALAAACSPRTRGWSPNTRSAHPNPPVLPAHAGMVPRLPAGDLRQVCAPRARGDGPNQNKPKGGTAWCSPRTRGWSPDGAERRAFLWCSPRTRGWSPAMRWSNPPAGVLPAHAGMVPPRRPHGQRP